MSQHGGHCVHISLFRALKPGTKHSPLISFVLLYFTFGNSYIVIMSEDR